MMWVVWFGNGVRPKKLGERMETGDFASVASKE